MFRIVISLYFELYLCVVVVASSIKSTRWEFVIVAQDESGNFKKRERERATIKIIKNTKLKVTKLCFFFFVRIREQTTNNNNNEVDEKIL